MSGIETVAARFGWDRSWIYGKVGGAFVQDQFTVDANTQAYALAGGGGLLGGVSTVNETRVGVVLGLGLEYALLPNVSAKLEYDYIQLGNGTAKLHSRIRFSSRPSPRSEQRNQSERAAGQIRRELPVRPRPRIGCCKILITSLGRGGRWRRAPRRAWASLAEATVLSNDGRTHGAFARATVKT